MTTVPEPLPSDLAEAHAMILGPARGPPRRRGRGSDGEGDEVCSRFGDRAAQAPSLRHVVGAQQPAGTAGAGALRARGNRGCRRCGASAAGGGTAGAAPRHDTAQAGAAAPRCRHTWPRTRVVYPAPTTCPCCGGAVRKLGEEITESLERLPARWFVISTCGRRCRAAAARRSTRPRRRSTLSPAAAPAPTCSPR